MHLEGSPNLPVFNLGWGGGGGERGEAEEFEEESSGFRKGGHSVEEQNSGDGEGSECASWR